MKNILSLLVILFGSLGVWAQDGAVTKAQFDAVYEGSRDAWSLDNWKGTPFRVTTITGSSLEGRPQTDYASKTIVEYGSPTSSRAVYESSFNGRNAKTESIRLGDKNFVRTDGGDWKDGAFETQKPAGKTTPAEKSLSEQVEYKFLGTEKLSDQTARVYAVTTKRVNANGGQETLTNTTTKYWFAENGSLLKTDMVMESRTGEKTTRSLLTQMWETDETIKIIAPTTSAAQKQ
jgi:hypothetical protein